MRYGLPRNAAAVADIPAECAMPCAFDETETDGPGVRLKRFLLPLRLLPGRTTD